MREGEDSNRRAKGVARYRQAVEIFRRGDLQWALRVLEPWVQELDPEQMDAWGCRGLGLAAELMLELGDGQGALEVIGRAVPYARAHGAADVQADSLRTKGKIERHLGDLKTSGSYLQQARQLCRSMKDEMGEADCYLEAGRLADSMDDVDQARAFHEQAVLRLERARDPHAQEFALLVTGDLMRLRGQLDEAGSAYERARSAFVSSNGRWGMTQALIGLAETTYLMGQLDEAERLHVEVLKCMQEFGSVLGQADVMTRLGHCQRALGNLQTAADSYGKAGSLYAGFGCKDGLIPDVHLALLHLRRGHVLGARSSLKGLLNRSETTSRLGLATLCHLGLLCCATQPVDWRTWDDHYLRARKLIRQTRRSHRDIASLARMASKMARRLGTDVAVTRAARASQLAAGQWVALGVGKEVQREGKTLRQLARQGARVSVGAYDLLEPLGQGTNAEVWRGLHQSTGVETAVKIIPFSSGVADHMAGALEKEVVGLQTLQHPNVIRPLDQGVVEEAVTLMTGGRIRRSSVFYVMELCGSNETLASHCGTLAWKEVRVVLERLLDALAHVHARNVIHLDIKPANILIDQGVDGRIQPRLADFGIARCVGELMGRAVMVGTPAYMSPEQFARRTRDFGPWTDMYALGCVAAELVCGKPLFVANSVEEFQAAHLLEERPTLSPVVEVPTGFDAWLELMLEPSIRDRIQHAADALWALNNLDALSDMQTYEDDSAGPVDWQASAVVSGTNSRSTREITFSLDELSALDNDLSTRAIHTRELPAEGELQAQAVGPDGEVHEASGDVVTQVDVLSLDKVLQDLQNEDTRIGKQAQDSEGGATTMRLLRISPAANPSASGDKRIDARLEFSGDADTRRLGVTAPTIFPQHVSSEGGETDQDTAIQSRRRMPGPRIGVHSVPEDWRLMGTEEGTDDGSLPTPVSGLRAVSLVGREPERDRLWAVIKEITSSRSPRFVSMRGPAGIGKTCLSNWLVEQCEALGCVTAFRVSHGPLGATGEGLSGALAGFFRCHGLDEAETRRQITRWYSFESESEQVHLQALVDIIAGSARDRTTANRRLEQRRDSVGWFLARLASQRPLLVVIDDALLGMNALYLARSLMGTRLPILVITNSQHEREEQRSAEMSEIERLCASPESRRIEMGPMERSDQIAMIQSSLAVQPTFAARVAEQAQGNPQFALQLVADQAERGSLKSSAEGLQLRSGAQLPQLGSLSEMWMFRIRGVLEGLESVSMEALCLAAVMGPRVHLEQWLRGCTKMGLPGVERTYVRLIRSGLAVDHSPYWAFVHSMIVQGLSDLAHSHGLVESLNAVSAEVLREEGNANEGELGRYLCFSGEPERALEPLGNAVSGAVRRREIAMARQWVELLAHAMTLADVALDEPRWGQLWIDQADIWIELGRIPEAEACIDRVLAKADTRGWTRLVLKAGRRKADLLRWANRSEQAAQRYEEVKAKLENIEQGLEYYRCLYGLGVLYRRRGALLNAERALTAAIRYCQQQSPSALMVYSVLALGGVLRTGSRLKEAQACFVEAHRLAIQLGIPAVAVDCHIGLGELARLTGGLDEAEGYYQSALDLSPPWVSHRWAFAEMNMCMVLLARGRWDEANFRLHRVCACAGPLNMPMLETMGKLLATPIQIGDLNDTEWTAYVKDVEQALRTTGMFDPDLGWVFALAATRAKWMGHNSRCLKMLELAAAQWKALGRTQEESAVLARIKDLENAGPG